MGRQAFHKPKQTRGDVMRRILNAVSCFERRSVAQIAKLAGATVSYTSRVLSKGVREELLERSLQAVWLYRKTYLA
jgi:hypothetical protein